MKSQMRPDIPSPNRRAGKLRWTLLLAGLGVTAVASANVLAVPTGTDP